MHELLKALPRDSFERWVRTHEADKHSKGFGSWQQLVAMVYGHLAAVSSLRELEAGFNSQLTHHYHLGCSPVRRSTMADANAKRSPALLSTVVQALMTQVERRARREVGALLVAIDSTSITLKGRGFDAWTQATQTRHTQGVKLHVSYALGSEVPIAQSITAPNINDIEEATKLPLLARTTYIFDKGYCDYTWWHRIDQAQAFFVTRFKRRRGTFVTEINITDLAHISDVRAQLEAHAAYRAAERLTAPQREELDALMAEVGSAAGAPETLMELDARVHRFVYRCAGNPYLRDNARALPEPVAAHLVPRARAAAAPVRARARAPGAAAGDP